MSLGRRCIMAGLQYGRPIWLILPPSLPWQRVTSEGKGLRHFGVSTFPCFHWSATGNMGSLRRSDDAWVLGHEPRRCVREGIGVLKLDLLFHCLISASDNSGIDLVPIEPEDFGLDGSEVLPESRSEGGLSEVLDSSGFHQLWLFLLWERSSLRLSSLQWYLGNTLASKQN